MPNTKRKPGLTLEEHQVLGKELSRHCAYVDDLIETVGNAIYYNYCEWTPERQLNRLDKTFGKLLAKLVATAVKDTRGALTAEEWGAIYYPPHERTITSFWPKRFPLAGLSLEEHRQVGLELARLRDRISRLSTQVCNRYPQSAGLGQPFDRVVVAIDDLRSWLEDRLMKNYADLKVDFKTFYYPTQEVRALGQARAS